MDEETKKISGSILNDIKKMLDIPSEIKEFDTDIIIHINSAFATLTQLGVGPKDSFYIEDPSLTWEDFIGEDYRRYQDVKLYIFYKTKLGFDPYTSSSVCAQAQKSIEELEWRLRIKSELEEVNTDG